MTKEDNRHITNTRAIHARRALKPLERALIEEGSTKSKYLSRSTLHQLMRTIKMSCDGEMTDHHIRTIHYWHITLRDKVKEAMSDDRTARQARRWLKNYINNIEVIEVDEYSTELNEKLKSERDGEWFIIRESKVKEVA